MTAHISATSLRAKPAAAAAVSQPERRKAVDLHLKVGVNETFKTLPIEFGSKRGFTDFLGWDEKTTEAFRQSAIAYFNERFGIDLANASFDPVSGITSAGFIKMYPVAFSSNYRVTNSNNAQIPPDSTVQIAEYVVLIEPPVPENSFYAGSYGLHEKSPMKAYESLSFGCYRLTEPGKVKSYDIFMRSTIPNRAENGATKVVFQLFSEEFGEGAGTLLVNMPMQANDEGLFPTRCDADWHFPPASYDATLRPFSEKVIYV